MVEILFLGTGASVVTARRVCSGILIEGSKLFDCGFGVLVNLRKAKANLAEIDEVYITHTHSDHVGDFTGLLWAMQLEGRERALRIVSSSKVASNLKRIMEAQSTPKNFIEFDLQFIRPNEIGVKTIRTYHIPENLAYRVDVNGSEIVYTGDTAYSEDVVRFSKEAGLLIHDSTFLSSQDKQATRTNHSTAKDAALTAHRANVKHLVMTHISPLNEGKEETYIEEAKAFSSARTTVARDLMRLNI
jgi:ribonuclease Z